MLRQYFLRWTTPVNKRDISWQSCQATLASMLTIWITPPIPKDHILANTVFSCITFSTAICCTTAVSILFRDQGVLLWHISLYKYPVLCDTLLFSSLVVWAYLRLERRICKVCHTYEKLNRRNFTDATRFQILSGLKSTVETGLCGRKRLSCPSPLFF